MILLCLFLWRCVGVFCCVDVLLAMYVKCVHFVSGHLRSVVWLCQMIFCCLRFWIYAAGRCGGLKGVI